jgi:cytochrome P450
MGLPGGVFGADGEAWKRQRRMVMAGLYAAPLSRYPPALVGVARRLAYRWRRSVGQPVDLQADLMRFTVDAVAGLAFGSPVDTLSSDGDVIPQHLDRVFPALFARIMWPLPTCRWTPRWGRSPSERRLEHSIAALNRAVSDFVAAARGRLDASAERRADPPNLLEAMIVAADEPGSGIDDEQVAGNVFTMLLADEDTTANTLAWAIELLWRHPAELHRASEEVRAVCGRGEDPTLEQLARLEHVESCLHETLRLKPVAPLQALVALRDSVVGDVCIPRGTVVLHLMRHDSLREAHVPRPEAFEPARWRPEGEPGALPAAARHTSMPFGAGPCICPGRYLALVEMKLALATLLGGFEIEWVGTAHGGPAAERLSFTMAPVGLTMRLREHP